MERVSLEAYKIFCETVRAGGISAAAKKMYLTQPAVSMAIKQLEQRLGKQLFNRTAKGVTMTAEGKILYEDLNQALGLIETAEEKFRKLVNLQAGEVKIGAGDTILSHFLLRRIEQFTQTYPGMLIKATNRTTSETIKSLRAGAVDVGFVNLPLKYEDVSALNITPCLEIHDCLVGGVNYARLAERGLRFDELRDYPLMLLENESNSRKNLNDYAREIGVELNPVIELGSYDLLLQFAEINLGLTFAVREFLRPPVSEEKGGLYEIPLAPEIPARHIGLVTLKNMRLSAAAEAFVKLIIP